MFTHIRANHCLLDSRETIFKDVVHNDFWVEISKDIFHACTMDGNEEIFSCLAVVDKPFVTLSDDIPVMIRPYR